MHPIVRTLVIALSFVATSAFADPPPQSHHHWRNANYANHYVLYDAASRQWIETINCQVAYRFNLVSNQMNQIILYDPSRNMTILLNYSGMYLKANGAADFSFYQAGTFDTRERYQHFDANGAYTGQISKGHACQWVEYLSGWSTPTFRFTLGNYNAGGVEIYDGSRNLWVRIDAQNKMYLRTGNQPFGFFKNGRWN